MSQQVIWRNFLEDQVHDNNVYRIKKGDSLHFLLGPSLLGQKLRLFTNYPIKDDPFERGTFYELAWQSGSVLRNDDSSKFASVGVERAGVYNYYYVADERWKQQETGPGSDDPTQLDDISAIESSGSGFFHVIPHLQAGKKEEHVPLDAVQCLTFVSKLLGALPAWRSRVGIAPATGYNMVHLTPVQHRGHSNSAYSLRDYLTIDPGFGPDASYDSVGRELEHWRSEWGVLTVGDVVFNHVSDDNAIITEHPDVGFNLVNSPHLRPAFLLDRLLAEFGDQVAADQFAAKGLPALINTQEHMQALRRLLNEEIFPRGKFHEFFECDVDKLCNEFRSQIEKIGGPSQTDGQQGKQLQLVAEGTSYLRLSRTVDMQLALALYNCHRHDCHNEHDRKESSVWALRCRLNELNTEGCSLCASHLANAVNAVLGHVSYARVQQDGPRVKVFNKSHPLVTSYFTYPFKKRAFSEEEALMLDDSSGRQVLAYNGWVMGDDPLRNFAVAPSEVYFRRELVCWGDCVKLRYGQGPADSPFLWSHMEEYVRANARIFHGFRLDNCHSTPLHVAEHLVDVARQVRPDLYVVAELFTGSEDLDNLFVNRLGITSLIREAQTAPDAHEEGRLVYKYGGVPVGAFMQRNTRPLVPQIAHALFMDMTHDNKCPIQTRSIEDIVPTAALVGMACCATGSTRGYDELVPYEINVVHEQRLYRALSDKADDDEALVSVQDGVLSAKAAINQLHTHMALHGYNQIYVDDRSKDVVCVTRHCPIEHRSVVAVARTNFHTPTDNAHYYLAPVQIGGVIDKLAYVCHPKYKEAGKESERYIVGLDHYTVITEHGSRAQFCGLEDKIDFSSDENNSVIEFNDFAAGAVAAFQVSMSKEAAEHINELRLKLCSVDFCLPRLSGHPFAANEISHKLQDICAELSLSDLNIVMFRCHEEEADEGWGGGAYDVPAWGKLPFCGLQGIVPLLTDIRLKDDLGHPVCANVRAGDWLVDYIIHRLTKRPSTVKLASFFGDMFAPYRRLPHYLKPAYFDAILCSTHDILCRALWSKMAEHISQGSEFVRALALATVAFTGHCRSSALPKLSPALAQAPAADQNGAPTCISISAGLPHFATGIFRNWGRDTFIALPGCLLVTGRFNEARSILLAFAGTLRHGLIPNLLGEGVAARYNCRDAVWFWLYSIKLYCDSAPDGLRILNDVVNRLYAHDDAEAYAVKQEEPLAHTIHEALNRHFQGIDFRERNAGSGIDEHMQHRGFDVKAYVCRQTGFVFGGNEHNCGTWMDKMGSSDKAGNRGQPATPRDGAAVELQGLCKAVLDWLSKLHADGHFKFSGVAMTDGNERWTWNEWAQRIQQNFEPCFFVASKDATPANPEPKYINKVNVCKDTYRASQPWTDYQLRPNFAIAITAAPDLLQPSSAYKALLLAQEHLQGPLGMKTLDPSDWAYCGDYNNDDDSHDKKTAKGWNYHQGPEWLWVTGYFLRALLTTVRRLDVTRAQKDKVITTVKRSLACHYTELQNSAWRSLPELTNSAGSLCGGSCRAQAWSVGCILEVMLDLQGVQE